MNHASNHKETSVEGKQLAQPEPGRHKISYSNNVLLVREKIRLVFFYKRQVRIFFKSLYSKSAYKTSTC